MGFISASFTVIIGYFTIEFLKKNKESLKNMPIVADFIDKKDMKTVSNDAYLIVLALALKDFIF